MNELDSPCKVARPPSISEALKRERESLRQRLGELDTVIEKLDANPETRDLIDAVSKIGALRNY